VRLVSCYKANRILKLEKLLTFMRPHTRGARSPRGPPIVCVWCKDPMMSPLAFLKTHYAPFKKSVHGLLPPLLSPSQAPGLPYPSLSASLSAVFSLLATVMLFVHRFAFFAASRITFFRFETSFPFRSYSRSSIFSDFFPLRSSPAVQRHPGLQSHYQALELHSSALRFPPSQSQISLGFLPAAPSESKHSPLIASP